MFLSAPLSYLQDYHNLRAATFNSQVWELNQKTIDLTESRSKCFVFYLTWGRVSAPTGCSPRDSGRLLSCRAESFLATSFLLLFFFTISAEANADLREQLGGAQTALRAKEAKYNALAQEHDRLVNKLADQAERHKAALKAAQDSEAALQAEYDTEAASWAEARQALSDGYDQIEDLVDGRPPSSSSLCLPPTIWSIF